MSTTLSTCTYIINRGKKDKERVCGDTCDGPLCSKHSKMGTPRKTAKRFDDGDEEEDTFESEISSPLASRTTRQSTPVATPPPRSRRTSTPAEESPSRPSTERSANSGRKLRNSTSVEDSPKTSRRNTPIRSSISAATDTPPRTNTPRRGTPRLNKGSSTSTATLESASAYKPISTPPRSTGNSSDNIEVPTTRLNGLTVRDEVNNDLDSGKNTESDTLLPLADGPKMPKRTNTADSAVSHGPRDPTERKLMEYIPESVSWSVAGKIMQVLRKPPRNGDEKGFVYMLRVTPYPPEPSSEREEGNKMMIIKVGNSKDVQARLRGLRGAKCKFFRYERLELYPNGIGDIELKYKAEDLVHAQLSNWRYRSAKRCPCNSEHKEFFEVTPEKELKAVYDCINHWAQVVNEHHNTLWPGEVERLKLLAEKKRRES
ncbi:hypothetical protein TSTA_048320 [Talaromyces stipitatus ATCC 10500]|uniref:Bacteriophage T5 Orf172 DNA-binding domain-containing protein n=1 Tax=Talaromyces stipitatus (strain ATCC 10500 / CBS 375.48 / QM 6759 / NRRL 1006) TaxID=441959 RepID=B8MKN5_TALSN|nr:uncharacterized protein TSTA_048320 [Talaromyces stipitatus ATCC 10500]EED15390.1 hypothetical protein TSTA_048320 [Talaromyces stipitatus ATCC 10500]